MRRGLYGLLACAGCLADVRSDGPAAAPDPAGTGERCGDGLDDDGAGGADEGCSCTPGDDLPCYLGPAETRGVGACRDGHQLCTADGSGEFGVLGACVGGAGPGVESCNGIDDDCDGTVDDGVCDEPIDDPADDPDDHGDGPPPGEEDPPVGGDECNVCVDPWSIQYCVDDEVYVADCDADCRENPEVIEQTCGVPAVAGECDPVEGACLCWCEDGGGLEQYCDDGIDDDYDGAVDCMDEDCRSAPAC